MIKVQLLLHSINPNGQDISTWVLTFPRMILAEINTHRLFSRNASSSRAIPIKKMLESIEENPAMFEYWGSNKPGMQAGNQLTDENLLIAKNKWIEGSKQAIKLAQELSDIGLHKQNVNRVLEPFGHITVILTTTDLGNFFALRAHPDAQPEFQVLAYRMLDKYLHSLPKLLNWNDWHIPFGDRMSEETTLKDRLRIATARCARVSYLTFNGIIDSAKDISLHDQLAKSGHWSPFEHSAQAKDYHGDNGNFHQGWLQYRKFFDTERKSPSRVELEKILQGKPEWVTL